MIKSFNVPLIVFCAFLLLSVRSAAAAIVPYTPNTVYTVFPSNITSPSGLNLPPSSGTCVACVPSNGMFGPGNTQLTAVPNSSGGGIEIPAVQQFVIDSPSGSSPVTGIPEVPSGVFNETINMGAGGAGSPAALMSENALGLLGAGAGIFVGSPLVKLAGAITLGSALYNALKGQGITSNADGSASISQTVYGCGFTCPIGIGTASDWTAYAAQDSCHAASWSPSAYTVAATPVSSTCSGRAAASYACSSSLSSPSPATNQNIIDALNKATQAMNVAADAVNWSMSQGVPIPAGQPVTSVPPSVALSGNPTLTNTQTDTTGNTTNTYSQPTSNIAPSTTTGSPPAVTPGSRTTQTVNNSPTTINNTFSPPMTFAPPIAGGGGVPGQELDICVLHPDILACSNDASLNDLPQVQIQSSVVNVGTITPVVVGSALGVCPAPILLPSIFKGAPMVLDIWSPICSFANYIRAVNVAAGALLSMYIIMGAIRNV